MAVINKCLKGVFIGVNVLYIILALIVFICAIILHIHVEKDQDLRKSGLHTGLTWNVAHFWVFGIGVLVVVGLGIHAVIKEKIWPLISFITAHTIGVVISIMNGINVAQVKKLLTRLLTKQPDQWSELETQLTVYFTLAVLGAIAIALAGLIIRQLRQRGQESAKY